MTKTPEGLRVVRLGPGDVGLARRTFAMMAEVFAEDDAPGASRLSDAYLSRLLSREDFWALAAAEGIGVVFVPADDEDTHALDFYRAMGGEPQPVTIFTFDKRPGQKPSNSGR